MTTPIVESRPAEDNGGTAQSEDTGRGDKLNDQGRHAVHHALASEVQTCVVVVVDISELGLRPAGGDAVRRRLWDMIEPLPRDTLVRLVVGGTTPPPFAIDGLRLGHVRYQIEGSFRAASAWVSALSSLEVR